MSNKGEKYSALDDWGGWKPNGPRRKEPVLSEYVLRGFGLGLGMGIIIAAVTGHLVSNGSELGLGVDWAPGAGIILGAGALFAAGGYGFYRRNKSR